jgi:hypothetical protein
VKSGVNVEEDLSLIKLKKFNSHQLVEEEKKDAKE